MKRYLAIIVAVVMCVAMCGCNIQQKRAYDDSKEAFEKINQAYTMVEEYGSDLYEAWRMGINELEEITGEQSGYYSTRYDYEQGFAYFCDELAVSQEDLSEAVAFMYYGEDYKTEVDLQSPSQIAKAYENLLKASDSKFSICVHIVTTAYELNGRDKEIEDLLDEAKVLMKEMSKQHSDYEHYPNLKGYFTNTLAFFDFCKNPVGSFEQVKETINDYRNEAREYFFDLNYIFED